MANKTGKNGAPTGGPRKAMTRIRERRQERKEREKARQAILRPFYIISDILWTLAEGVAMVILTVVMVVVTPLWMIYTLFS